MILRRFAEERQTLSDRSDGGLPNGAGEELRAQSTLKGRFYALKSFESWLNYQIPFDKAEIPCENLTYQSLLCKEKY